MLFLERAAIEVNQRVRLIAADEALDAELHITAEGVRHVVGLLRRRFDYIIVDMPVPLVPAFRPVIALSDMSWCCWKPGSPVCATPWHCALW